MQALLKDLREDPDSPTVHNDGKVAHDSLVSENFSNRLKHVIVARQWIREQLDNGIIKVKHVRIYQEHADFFIKPLPAATFKN